MSPPSRWDEPEADYRIEPPRLSWAIGLLVSAAVGALVATLLFRVLP